MLQEQRIDNVHEDILSQFVEKYCNYSGDIQKGMILFLAWVYQILVISEKW